MFSKIRRQIPRAVIVRRGIAIRSALRSLPLVEPLDNRMMLSASSYDVPADIPDTSTAITDVYLRPDPFSTDIEVRFDQSPTAPVYATLAFDPTTDIIAIHGNRNGLTLHDFVPAADKQVTDDSGDTFGGTISFDNSSNGKLEINGGVDDAITEITSASANGATISTYDTADPSSPLLGTDILGAGVTNLSLLPSTAASSTAFYAASAGAPDPVNNSARDLPALPPSLHLDIDTQIGTNATINIGGNGGPAGELASNVDIHTGAGDDAITIGNDEDDASVVNVSFDRVTGSSSGNSLIVGEGATAMLAGGTVGAVTVSTGGGVAPATLIVSAATTIGNLTINSGAVGSIQAPLTVTGTASFAGTVAFTGAASGSSLASMVGSAKTTYFGTSVTHTGGTVNAAPIDSSSNYNIPIATTGGTTITKVTLKSLGSGSFGIYFNNDSSADHTLAPGSSQLTLHGNNPGLIFVDEVSAADKPSGHVFFDNASGGTLDVDDSTNFADRLMQVTVSSATGATIEVSDTASNVGIDQFGDGVTNLTLRTNDKIATDYYANGGDGSEVDVAYGTTPLGGDLPELSPITALTVDTGAGTYDTIHLGAGAVDAPEDPVQGLTVTGAIVHTGAGHDTVSVSGDFSNAGGAPDEASTARIDFDYASSLGSGNVLISHNYGIATLVGGHVDEVSLADGNLVVGAATTVGSISVDATASTSTIEVDAPLTVMNSAGTTGVVLLSNGSTITFTGSSATSQVHVLDLEESSTANVGYLANVSIDTMTGTSGTIIVAADGSMTATTATVGSLDFDLTTLATASVGTLNSSGRINLNNGGLLTVDSFNLGANGLFFVNAGGEATINTLTSASSADVSVALGGTLTVNTLDGGRVIQAFGTLNITGPSTIFHLEAEGLLNVTRLDPETMSLIVITNQLEVGNGGKLDLNDNDLIYETTNIPNAMSAVGGWLQQGYDSGNWDGAGISSTSAKNDPSRIHALGYADAADVGLTTVDGFLIPSGTDAVVIRYTYYGDSSLDGKVDLGNDFNLFLQGYLNHLTSWELGDYNYDGTIDNADFQLFIDGFKSQGGALSSLEGTIEGASGLTAAQKQTELDYAALDTSFGTSGVATTDIQGLRDILSATAVTPDGHLLTAGYSEGYAGSTPFHFAVVEYNADGSLNTSFGTGGKVVLSGFTSTSSDNAEAIVVQSDGKFILVGFTTDSSYAKVALARFNSDGSLDTTYGTSGRVVSDTLDGNGAPYLDIHYMAAALDSSGKLLVTASKDGDFELSRYTTAGALDTTFGSSGTVVTDVGGTDTANSIAIQSDGKIVIAGNSGNSLGVVRYTSSGALDTTFATGGIFTGLYQAWCVAFCDGIAIQPSDGKILIGGESQTGSTSYGPAILRLTSGGAIDTTFASSGSVVVASLDGWTGFSFIRQSDGSLVLVGGAPTGGSCTVRFTSSGSLDTSFAGTGIAIMDMGFQDVGLSVTDFDGNIIVGGTINKLYGNGEDFAVVEYLS
jgi:uncharacterized delta-60 repeat protein